MNILQCRTCLEEIKDGNSIGVQIKVTDNENVLQAIEKIATVQCSFDDPFPKSICQKCFKLLKSAVTFHHLIISSYHSFKNKLTVNISVQKYDGIQERLKYVDIVEKEKDFLKIKDEKFLENQNSENEQDVNSSETEESPNIRSNSKIECIEQKHKIYNVKDKELFKLSPKDKDKPQLLGKTSRQCSQCGQVIKGIQNYKAHMKKHKNKMTSLMYVCTLCSKKFARKEYLLVHKRTHTGEKPYHCDICNKNFSQLASFYIHKRRLHEKVIQGTCNYCGKKFVDKLELDIHIKTWHTGERPYLCEVCSATFVCNRALQRHRKELHFEKKPCQKCGKMLGDYALRKHLFRHQVIEDGLKVIKKKYTCEYCNAVMNFTSRRRHLERQHGIKLYGK